MLHQIFTSKNAVQVNAEVHQASGLDLEQALEEPETTSTPHETPQSTTVDANTEESFSVLKVVTTDLSIVKTLPGDTPRQQHPMWCKVIRVEYTYNHIQVRPIYNKQR